MGDDTKGFGMPCADELGAAFTKAQNANTTVKILKCKCGNMSMIPQRISEVRINSTPGMLADHPVKGIREVMEHRDLSCIYVCAMCGKVVYVHQINKPTEIPEAKAGNNIGVPVSKEHTPGIEKVEGPG